METQSNSSEFRQQNSDKFCKNCSSVEHLKACNGCHNIYYCSRQCQINDWLHHKSFCCGRETFNIWVKFNSNQKTRLVLRESSSGVEIIDQIISQLSASPDRFKLIFKGQLVTSDNAQSLVRENGIFLAIGIKMESSEGLEPSDIDVLMSQLSIKDRNDAICALRQCNGNLVDAILYLGSK